MMEEELPRWGVAPEAGVCCSRLGEAGGPLYVAGRRSLSWAPWKVERLEEPREKRPRSGVVLLLLVTLKAEGDDGAGCWELGVAGQRLVSIVTKITGLVTSKEPGYL